MAEHVMESIERSASEYLSRLTDRWSQAVWETSANGLFAADSPSWRAFTGQSRDEWLRYGWAEPIHEVDRPAVLASWREAIANGTALDVEFRIRTSGGIWTWTNARAVPVRAPDGTIQKWVGINIDVGARRKAEFALRESEERYRLIFENAVDYVIIALNLQGSIMSWSPGAAAAFGWPAGSALGRPFAAVCRRAIVPPVDERLNVQPDGLGGAQEKFLLPAWYLRRDGSRMYLEGTSRTLTGTMRGQPRVLIVGKDTTRQRQIEEALYLSEARYRNLVDGLRNHSIFLTDEHGTISQWTAAAEAVTGYAETDVLGSHLSLLYTPEAIAAGEVKDELAEAALWGKAEREGWRVQKGGRRIWSEEITTAVRDRNGKLSGYSKVGRDLTERQQIAESTERERRRTAGDRLRASLALAEEEERRRLARDLHDTAGQRVTALSLGLRRLGDLVPEIPGVQGHVERLLDLAATLGAELHEVATRLRPRALDDFGFEDAIGAAAKNWSRHTGIASDVYVSADGKRPTPEIENALYRIVQEALTNVARHSGASKVGIMIRRPLGHVLVIVEDDGHGFEVPSREGGTGSGLGLLGIYERAESLGGSVDIESDRDKGTTLFVRFPV